MERREEEKGLVASLVVPTLGRLRHEGQCMFEAISGYIHTNKRFEWLPELLVYVGSQR